MIKGITNAQLRATLRERLVKLAVSEARPDPGPNKPSERSSQLFELAFRRGTVRQLVELIVLAEYDLKKPKENATHNDVRLFEAAYDKVIEEEMKKSDYHNKVEAFKLRYKNGRN